MKVLPLVALAVCLSAGPARADLQYAFNVTSTSGALQPFSFSFTSATFLADNDVPTLSPFTVTNGSLSWTLTHGLVTQNPNGCFEFGTAAGSTLGTCNVGDDGLPVDAALLLQLGVAIPTATGVYDFTSGEFVHDGAFIADLTGSLDITSIAAVPEPASVGLFVMVLALVGWKLNRRYAHAHCDGKV
jgi:PEP-CTERM motif